MKRDVKRILMTADTVGGVWTYSLQLAAALAAYGVEVGLATMGAPPSQEQRHEAARLANLTLFESAYKLEWMEHPWDDIGAAGNWLLELEQEFSPEVVHLNGYAHGDLPWSAPKVVVGHSCVLSWWQAVRREPAPGLWRTYRERVRAGLQAADLVIAPSGSMLERLREHYGALPQARVIPNGRTLTGCGAAPKEPMVLGVGRVWDEAKNLASLAAIAPRLSWPVYIAGQASEPRKNGAVARQSPAAEAKNHAIYLGHLPERELVPWFARASIYALPARYEPFGLSVLEAALAGCALVLGDIASLREIWGRAALFVPPDDAAALEDAVEGLIAHKAWRQELGVQAQSVARQYTPEKAAAAYYDAYTQLLRKAQSEPDSREHLPQHEPTATCG